VYVFGAVTELKDASQTYLCQYPVIEAPALKRIRFILLPYDKTTHVYT